mgnify:FL=1
MVKILVTLSITAVLASVSLPPLTNLIESSQADSEAADFFTSLLLARSDSATRNNMVTLFGFEFFNFGSTAAWSG